MSLRRFIRNILDSTHSEWMKLDSGIIVRCHGIPNNDTRWRFKIYRIIYSDIQKKSIWHYANTLNSFGDSTCQLANTYDINFREDTNQNNHGKI